jgi:PAS domain S-box-containing protein
MENPQTPTDQQTAGKTRKFELPWLIVAALLVSTIATAYQSWQQAQVDARNRFAELAAAESRGLSRQIRAVEDLLGGIRAFTTAAPDLSRTAWETYIQVRAPKTEERAGLAGLRWKVQGSRAATAKEGFTTYLPTPPAAIPDPEWEKFAAVSEGLSKSAASGKAVLTRPLGSPSSEDAGAILAMVMRWEAGTGPGVQDNLIALIDLSQTMRQLEKSRAAPVVVELFDGDDRLFGPSSGAGTATRGTMSADLPLAAAGRELRVHVASTPALDMSLQNNTPRTILMIGILSSLLLAGLIWLLTRLREQAEALATRMTSQLQQQTRFTEELIEFNPSPIFRKDPAGRFVSVNRAWEQLTGRSRGEVLGKTYQDFLPGELADTSERLDQEVFASTSGYQVGESVIVHRDGRQLETIVAKQVLRGATGETEGMIGTITDVTPIKRLEREVAMQRERLNLVIRSSQQGIWDVDMSAGGSAYFSERFREMLGYGLDDFPEPFDWRMAIHPEDEAAFARQMAAHFKRQTPLFDIESRIRCKDGGYIWVRTRAIAQHDASGRAIRFVGSISDVTDRKKAEQELVDANVRVTDAARAKEAFLATMSHEIRTPLNGVLGMASLLSETALNDEQHDYIRLIRASGDTLLRLIDDVLDFSKIESGRMTLESVPVELVPLAEEAFDLVAEKAREKQLSLLFDVDDDCPYYILGDPTRLRQVLLNLLTNAIKFTERGEVRLSLSGRRTFDGQVLLEGRVSDSGIGIPADRAGQLFQSFTQVDASTTRKYGGTGLGLAICKRLTQLMGGDIRVESVEGQGSTFIFSFLTQASRGPLKPYMQRDVFDFVGKRVLVVDSNPNRHPILIRTYARWGWETVCVLPAEAVRAFQERGPFDVMISDTVAASPESQALAAALKADDAARAVRGVPPMKSILVSSISRAELSQSGVSPALRHDFFVMRPVGRARMFDVLMRAVLQEPNLDVATRPYMPEPVYDREFSHVLRGGIEKLNPRAANTGFKPVIRVAPAHVMRVLVAEDNEVNQQVILGMLKNLGHRVAVVGDGRSAVNRAIAEDFDIILMDIHMPELDGIGAMKEIRAHLLGGKCPPIAAMTAHALPGDREHYIAVGMDDYIAKPVRPAELAELLDRVLNNTHPGATAPATIAAIPPVANIKAPASGAPASENILDFEQLEDLRGLPAMPGEASDPDDPVGGLIRLFQEKTAERLQSMIAQHAGSQWALLADTAHSLRGAAASMGFVQVAARCKDLELAARAFAELGAHATKDDAGRLGNLVTQIADNYAEANIALGHWISRASNAS